MFPSDEKMNKLFLDKEIDEREREREIETVHLILFNPADKDH